MGDAANSQEKIGSPRGGCGKFSRKNGFRSRVTINLLYWYNFTDSRNSKNNKIGKQNKYIEMAAHFGKRG